MVGLASLTFEGGGCAVRFKYSTIMATRKANPYLDHRPNYPMRRALINSKIKQCHDYTSPEDLTVTESTTMTTLLVRNWYFNKANRITVKENKKIYNAKVNILGIR